MSKRMIIFAILSILVMSFALAFLIEVVYPKLKAEAKDIIHNPK